MAFFPRTIYGSDAGFTPLFRLLDDFDSYSRQGNRTGLRHCRPVQTFQPKFDVREVEDAYLLHGELAGLSKKDVHIEFADPQNLVVRGRIQRSYATGTPLVQDTEMSGAITESGEENTAEVTTPKHDHQATVEDEEEDGFTNVEATPATTVAEEPEPEEPEKKENPADKAKYWLSERSIGDFSRTFNFPQRVEQEGVSAKLEDGILNIRVPKAKKHEARRIDIL